MTAKKKAKKIICVKLIIRANLKLNEALIMENVYLIYVKHKNVQQLLGAVY